MARRNGSRTSRYFKLLLSARSTSGLVQNHRIRLNATDEPSARDEAKDILRFWQRNKVGHEIEFAPACKLQVKSVQIDNLWLVTEKEIDLEEPPKE